MALAIIPEAKNEFVLPSPEKPATDFEKKLEEIGRAASEINRILPPNARRGQALGELFVEGLINICETYQGEEAVKEGKRLHALMKRFVPEREWNITVSGFAGEAALNIMSKRLGFEVLERNIPEDDLIGKIDLWIKDPNSESAAILALQLKTVSGEPDLSVIPIEDQLGNVKPTGSTYEKYGQAMLDYLDSTDNLPAPREKIKPAIVIMPGGLTDEGSFYNTTTGMPVRGKEYVLFDELVDAGLI